MKIQLAYERLAQVKTDLLVVILDEGLALSDLQGAPFQDTVRRVERNIAAKTLKTHHFSALNGGTGPKHLLVFSTALSKTLNVWETFKVMISRSIRIAQDNGLQKVAIALNGPDALPFIGKAVEGAMLGSYSFDRYKSEKSTLQNIDLQLIASKENDARNRKALERYTLVSGAINQARDMINEPGDVATPEYLAQAARKIARESNLDVKVWNEKELKKEGYNGLIQVGKGSVYPPRMIRLRYRTRKAKHHLALVGKGVTFDTGGISIKPADKMWEMKGDMSGGAAVLFAMQAIGKLCPDVDVTGIVVTAENAPDANAQRPGDIFFAKNGKSIMVDNTDAEGRLILTDGLHLAGTEKATHILDIATLTGAVVRALGNTIAGVMGNNAALARAVIQSGQNHGESFWELPLPEEYKELLKTPCADLNNIGGPVAGALTAGLFLQEFVPAGAAWAHLDIAGPYLMEKEWKYYEAGAIGFGLKTLVDVAERFNDYF